jgi:hypothetical protein
MAIARRLYCIRVDIFEEATRYAYPVVTHLFHGKTRAEARRYHASHRAADRFLRACEDSGVFEKKVKCKVRIREGWV